MPKAYICARTLIMYCIFNFITKTSESAEHINLLKPASYFMHQQFNIQQLYVLPHTVFMCFVFI
jgi:hypothetical protein